MGGALLNPGPSLATTSVFDFANETWTDGPTLSTARQDIRLLEFIAASGRIYVIGGGSQSIEYLDILNGSGFGWSYAGANTNATTNAAAVEAVSCSPGSAAQ
jgi:hypothetical protein